MAANYAFHDLSRIGGRVLAVADIHGCFDLLEQELEAIGFNGDADVLISLGDIVDRGPKDGTGRSPESLDIMRRLRALRIRGNHEIFAAESAAGDIEAQNLHAVNGGMWLAFTPEEERHKFVELANAPVAIEVLTPGGHRVGFALRECGTRDPRGRLGHEGKRVLRTKRHGQSPTTLATQTHVQPTRPRFRQQYPDGRRSLGHLAQRRTVS